MKKIYFIIISSSMLISFSACTEDDMYDIQYHEYNYHKAEKKPQYHHTDSCNTSEFKKTTE